MSGQGKTWKLYNRDEELMELWKAAKNDCEIAEKMDCTASAKAKTPVKLRKQLAEFVIGVNDGVNLISSMGNAEEIMVEFRECLDASKAIGIVLDRHRRIEEQKSAQEARTAAIEQEAEMVRRVEALAPPAAVEHSSADKATIRVQLTLYPTKRQFEEKIKLVMRQLKEICDTEGIQYE